MYHVIKCINHLSVFAQRDVCGWSFAWNIYIRVVFVQAYKVKLFALGYRRRVTGSVGQERCVLDAGINPALHVA